MTMNSGNIEDIVMDLTIRCTERASFFLAGFGLSSGNDLLSLGTGAFTAPESVEAGKRIGVYYDNKRTFTDAALFAVGYGSGVAYTALR